MVLEIGRVPDTHDAMGRPPLGMKPTTIRLPSETIQRIEALVGNRRLALFIHEAIDNELERRENPGK
jgi:hypothetical protein